jgi:hypothetical protein
MFAGRRNNLKKNSAAPKEETMTDAHSTRRNPTRRSVLKTAALGSVAAIAAP